MATVKFRLGPFSVVEVLVVLVILSVIGATAVPRLSRGSDAVADSALAGNLAVLRNGIELYASDHGGKFPSFALFEAQLTQYTDAVGDALPTPDETHRFGPYLRKVLVLPVGPKGFRGTGAAVDASKYAVGAATGGWHYNAKTGDIRANLPETYADSSGKQYCRY